MSNQVDAVEMLEKIYESPDCKALNTFKEDYICYLEICDLHVFNPAGYKLVAVKIDEGVEE